MSVGWGRVAFLLLAARPFFIHKFGGHPYKLTPNKNTKIH